MVRVRTRGDHLTLATDDVAEATGEEEEPAAELNLRILTGLARYLGEHFGDEVLESVAGAGGRTGGELDGRHLWVSHEAFEKILAAAREHLPDDGAFREACAYKMAEGYGPMVLFFWALSPGVVYEQSAKAYPTITTISNGEVIRESRTSVRLIYRSTKPESRSMCLSRQGQAVTLPLLWGLPPAELTEKRCIAWGDEACEYHLRWMDHRRWLPVLAGGLGGGVAWLVVTLLHVGSAFGALLPVLGLMLGTLLEQRRVNRSTQRYAEEHREALQQYAADTAATQRELMALQQRERGWSHLLEEQLNERSARLRNMAQALDKLREERLVVLRGLSHDIRNPLTVLRYAHHELDRARDRLGPTLASWIDDHGNALDRIQTTLEEMMRTATADADLVRVDIQPIVTEPLAEILRRRLQALCHGRDIRVSVFRTREAPELIHSDRFLLDRVIDNLLTNAAKYTPRGSIIVEIGGTPGFLTLKISDTGRGIAQDAIARIFQPGGSEEDERAPESFGVGLSVVVQLLDQLGARLEVMSKQAEGTTFWVHFPVDRPEGSAGVAADQDGGLLAKVVKIRQAKA